MVAPVLVLEPEPGLVLAPELVLAPVLVLAPELVPGLHNQLLNLQSKSLLPMHI